MKRFVVVTLICLLFIALLVPSRTAHAQSQKVQHASYTSNVTYSDTYFFNAGFWGWGVCIGHNDLQGIYNWSAARLVISATVLGRIPNWQIQAAGVALWIYIGSVKARDQGRGVCVAWPYYLPSIAPILWPR